MVARKVFNYGLCEREIRAWRTNQLEIPVSGVFLRKPKKNFTDWGRPGNKWHQIHCGNDTALEGDSDYTDDYNDATESGIGSETGSQIRKRRQMEIDITQPQIIPQPEKPKLTNRNDSTLIWM